MILKILKIFLELRFWILMEFKFMDICHEQTFYLSVNTM